jgi:nucleoside 2-deoxyribosyltransferase
MRIYIAAPLFSDAEKRFNAELDKFLTDLGFQTFLPQRDGFEKAQMDKTHSSELVNRRIFSKDSEEIKKCDILLIVLDGRAPDEGACVELGLAFALKKKCVGIKTDTRSLMDGQDNPMILGCLDWNVARTFDDLRDLLKTVVSSTETT